MEVFRSQFWTIERQGRRVRLARTDAAHPDIPTTLAAFEGILAALADLGDARAAWGILVDLRAAPQVTDPATERSIQPLRIRVFDGFAAGAVLVGTLSGRLQLHRLERIDQNYRTFDDEAEALAFLDAALDGA